MGQVDKSGRYICMHSITVYVIHLVLFNEPYFELQEITLEVTEELPKPA